MLDDLRPSYGAELQILEVPPEALTDAIRRAFAAQVSALELVRDLTEANGAASEPSANR
jgi:hypothetical protein